MWDGFLCVSEYDHVFVICFFIRAQLMVDFFRHRFLGMKNMLFSLCEPNSNPIRSSQFYLYSPKSQITVPMGASRFFNPSSVLAGPRGAVQGSVSCSSRFSINCVSTKQSNSGFFFFFFIYKRIMIVFFERLWMVPIEQLHDVPVFATPLLGSRQCGDIT